MKLSELFYSIQGEGATQGVTSLFIRLYGCNLMCGGPKGALLGKEVEGKKCSWWCDSEAIWRQYKEYTNEEIEQLIITEGEKCGVPLIQWLRDGTVHFIWTGGEPLMQHNLDSIKSFINYWNNKYFNNRSFHEVETNGTFAAEIAPSPKEMLDNGYFLFNQINCSVKLANSGMKAAKRIVPRAIKQIASHSNHWWKFVVDCTDEESAFRDIEEIETDYLRPFNLDRRQVILMPGVDNRADLSEVTRVLYEVAKKKGLRAVTRGHILAWNRTTGV